MSKNFKFTGLIALALLLVSLASCEIPSPPGLPESLYQATYVIDGQSGAVGLAKIADGAVQQGLIPDVYIYNDTTGVFDSLDRKSVV